MWYVYCAIIHCRKLWPVAVDDEVVAEVVYEIADVFRPRRRRIPSDGDGLLGVISNPLVNDMKNHTLSASASGTGYFQGWVGGCTCSQLHDKMSLCISTIGSDINLAAHFDGVRVLENEGVGAATNPEAIELGLVTC